LSLQKKNAPVKLLIQTNIALNMAKMASLFDMTIQQLTRKPKKTGLASVTSSLLEYWQKSVRLYQYSTLKLARKGGHI
jgi:hypothetical protein